MYNSEWFTNLNKPVFSPPDYIFTPVWTVLYIMLAVSLVLFLRNTKGKRRIIPLCFFAIQLLLNFGWSPVFFGLQNIGGALVILFLMIIFSLLTFGSFVFTSKRAAYLLIPYIFWITFALYLNFGFYVLN